MDSANPQAPSIPLSTGLGIKLYRYKSIIRRQWWVLALTIGLGLAYEGFVLFTKPQTYDSSAQLLLRDELVSSPAQEINRTEDRWGHIFDTAVEQIKSTKVLEGAKQYLALNEPQLVVGKVTIAPSVLPHTNILVVKGTGTNAEYTQHFVDATVDKFKELRDGIVTDTINGVSVALNERTEQLKALQASQQAKLQAFIKENNMPFWSEMGKTGAVQLANLKNQQSQLLNEKQRLESLTPDQLLQTPISHPSSTVNPANPEGKGQSGAGMLEASQRRDQGGSDTYAQYLKVTQELVQAQADVEQWKTIWKPKHPKMQALQTKVDNLQRLIAVIKEQNYNDIKGRLAAINAELKVLEKTIGEQESQVLEASRKDAQYQQLDSDVANTKRELESLFGNTSKLGNSRNAAPNPFMISQKATAPVANPPGTIPHLLIGLLGGFAVGMIILILLDRADDRISSFTEMQDHFSEPILGQIPNVADSRKDNGLPLLLPEDDRYTYAEAFRSLRSSLIFMPNQAELKTILITSAIPNEGKSTIASNLAITMAASGARVLLVDADLRRGDIAQLFDIDGRAGLSDILRGSVHWKEVVLKTTHPTLAIIPRGPVTNQSGELLLKPALIGLLDEFKDAYDLTIFNTAPILAADDTPTLAPNFDGSLMVIRASFTSARLSKNALNTLYQRQVNVLGLVLNCIDAEMPDYYYYQYPKYYAAS